METLVPGFEGEVLDVTLSFLILLLSFLARAVSVEAELVELGLSGLVWFLEEMLWGDFVVLVWFVEEILLVGLIGLVWFLAVVLFFKGFSCSCFWAPNILLLC